MASINSKGTMTSAMGLKPLVSFAMVLILTQGCMDSSQRAKPVLPPLTIPDDAPFVQEALPLLSSGPMAFARLIELPEGVLARTEDLTFTEEDLQRELAAMSWSQRTLFDHYSFYLLEQRLSETLLAKEAEHDLSIRGIDTTKLSPEMIFQKWVPLLLQTMVVTQEDIILFYTENQNRFGNTPFAELEPALHQLLLKRKQREAMESYVRNLGRRTDIAINAEWADRQEKAYQQNPVDQARTLGTPVMVFFDSDTCEPCRHMQPVLDSVADGYGTSLTMVQVNVERNPVLASRYRVQEIPHTLFFDGQGNEVARESGKLTLGHVKSILHGMGLNETVSSEEEGHEETD